MVKKRSNIEQVALVAESAARLIEGTVIRVYPQTRTAYVTLDGSTHRTVINLGAIDPSFVSEPNSKVLLYNANSILYAISVIPGQYMKSSPGITLGDSSGSTGLSVYNAHNAEVINIDSAGNINGVDIADHDSRHERAGADEIDGDHLDIDWNPSSYTPATTPSEAASVDDLTAHLYGIDQALGAISTGLDSTYTYTSSQPVTYASAGWTDIGSLQLTIPSGCRVFIAAVTFFSASSYSGTYANLRITDDTSSWATQCRVANGERHNCAVIGVSAKTGSPVTYTLQGNKDDNSGTVTANYSRFIAIGFKEASL